MKRGLFGLFSHRNRFLRAQFKNPQNVVIVIDKLMEVSVKTANELKLILPKEQSEEVLQLKRVPLQK